MRTTVDLDDDAARAVEELRRVDGRGLSEAVNLLIRRGLTVQTPAAPYQHETRRMGARMDVTNIGEVLDVIEGPTHG
jgi:Arc/MetJ family transcription regulator